MSDETSCCGPTCCSDDAAPVATATVSLARGTTTEPGAQVRAVVREKYGEAARRAAEGKAATCGCGTSGCGSEAAEVWDPITTNLYDAGEVAGVPAEALLASLGCGNPTALANLNAGERVLDLGSGGGIDVLLSARRVGPTGKAYGLDMTDEMLALAQENKARSGLTNVEFLRGEIEHIPLPAASVDVIISNCVINLSADKRQVLREAYRVLAPGGRFAVSDVVLRGELPDDVRRSVALFTGCVSGALTETEFLDYLRDAGFESPSIEPTRVYSREDAQALLDSAGLSDPALLDAVDGRVMSAFIRARKPGLATP
ncbi:MAG: arsenite methyltransferase [Gemmatimonadetes bacterium]|nr:arsenite methyltransferase [Gemmatimonadota bacterium]